MWPTQHTPQSDDSGFGFEINILFCSFLFKSKSNPKFVCTHEKG